MSPSQESVGAIIAAAGRSERMGGRDKLFAVVGGKPLLAHTLSAFQACRGVDRVVLVLASENMERGRELVAEAGFDKVAVVCQGGECRQDSVRNGLEELASCQWVVVHDGARPLVTVELIERKSIPDTQDIIGTYSVIYGGNGDGMTSYERTRVHRRMDSEEAVA